ncbi:OmpA family protein [Thiocapsa marina]|uniref:OmpA/MotB domain protein n=1 Tax=Thiocapsa marina 5811 TaxID=768671 RepID=F9UBW7_9GAMM|nr:OmpA family protein [Thiocapsa marina]EGV18435.1 OmpA/MotB domain protein [Thiocapsa marina 5811]
MRKQKKTSRLAALAAPLAMAVTMAAPLSVQADYNYDHFWSAQPEGTAWVTSYGECWQSLHGPDNLEPCVEEVVPKEFIVRLNFEFDKYELQNIVNDDELRRLDDYIAQVKATDTREEISLVGHTDAKGSDEYNMALGMRRAETVREYMISKGISPSDIVSVTSMGKREMLPDYDIFSVQQRRVKILAEYEGN